MTAECCESFAGTDMRGETIPDSRSSIINYRTNACCYFVSCNVLCNGVSSFLVPNAFRTLDFSFVSCATANRRQGRD